MNHYKHPTKSILGSFYNFLFNCRFIVKCKIFILKHLPFMVLKSDVTDVVYLNFFVDYEKSKKYIPEGMEVFRYKDKVLFTILTYQHHHFGPKCLGKFRQLFPSPLQSNWRFYIDNIEICHDNHRKVLFLKNILNSRLYTFGTRMMSNILPSHLAKTFQHTKNGRNISTKITSGVGSAPHLEAQLMIDDQHNFPHEFTACFGNIPSALDYICMQTSAMSQIDDSSDLAYAGIGLPIDITTIKPLKLIDKTIPFLDELEVNQSEAFCFLVPQVEFNAVWETLIQR